MIPLRGRSSVSNWVLPRTDVWQVAGPGSPDMAGKALVVRAGDVAAHGAGLYISTDLETAGPGLTVHVPRELDHLGPGDVVVVSDEGDRVAVAWKATATHNSILLTERCDHYCLMCSQPPKERDDSYLYERATRIISSLPTMARGVSLTGGEPPSPRRPSSTCSSTSLRLGRPCRRTSCPTAGGSPIGDSRDGTPRWRLTTS